MRLSPTEIVVIVVALAVTLVGILRLNDRLKPGVARKVEADGRVARFFGRSVSLRELALMGLVLALYVGYTATSPSRGAPVRAGIPPFTKVVFGLAALVAVAFVGFLVAMTLRNHDRGVSRALRMARSGDVLGAIEDLHAQIEARGPSAARANALASCHLLRREWPKAYIQAQDAERLDGQKGRYLGLQGSTLRLMGRAAEAIPLLERAAQAEPQNPSHAWNACLALADLGRFDEAGAQLRRAEELAQKIIAFNAAQRGAIEETLSECRARLAEAPGARPARTQDLS